jgi:hypothetical protein
MWHDPRESLRCPRVPLRGVVALSEFPVIAGSEAIAASPGALHVGSSHVPKSVLGEEACDEEGRGTGVGTSCSIVRRSPHCAGCQFAAGCRTGILFA